MYYQRRKINNFYSYPHFVTKLCHYYQCFITIMSIKNQVFISTRGYYGTETKNYSLKIINSSYSKTQKLLLLK